MKKRIQFLNQAVLSISLLLSLLLGTTTDLRAQSDYKLAEQDSLALVAFYWATDGPNWASNQPGFGINDLSSDWQAFYDGQFNPWFTGPVKDWFGVRVEKRPIVNSNDSIDRVTWIWPVIGRRTDGQNQLNGYVPREVGLLTNLNQLRVNGNDGFTNELLPDELYHPSLEYLDVESCWFGGGLSDEFRNCIGMKKLNARYNNFDYMPNWDFLDEDALRAMEGTQWLYNSRFSYAILEQVIDYFYSISPNIKEFQIEMRDMFDVGDEREIVAAEGSAVDIVCNDAGNQSSFITYQWFKNGLSMFGQTQKTLSIPSVSAGSYGVYKVRISNDYVKAYDQNTNYGEVFTKEIHLVAAPVAPVIERAVSSYNGQSIDLYLSKPMSASTLTGYQDLSLLIDGSTSIAVVSAEVLGRINRLVRVHLASPIQMGETIDLSLTTAGNIEDENGGVLQSFSALTVENRVRVAPQLLSAATTLDGSGIELYFDQYMSEESLDGASFLVEGDSNSYQVASISLLAGEVDQHISRTVLLNLTESIVDSAEMIVTQYLSGNLYGLYGGTAALSDTLPVLNQVSTDRIPVTLIFEDGSEALENLYVQASWKPNPLQMFDDGTHSDLVANDHVWTYSTQLVKDEYTWDALEREEIMAFDTVETVDPITGIITITLNPITLNNDSLLSGNFLLAFSVAETGVSGDTLFGIQNRDVIFHLRTTAATSDVYLMGIDGDWSVGRLMDEVTPGTFYADTLFKLTAGDVLEYNYRIGTDWENETPESRSYTVKNGPNLIQNRFGIFTSVGELEHSPISVYPNPSSDGRFTLTGLPPLSTIDLYTASGQFVRSLSGHIQTNTTIDLSDQVHGLYLVKTTSPAGQVYLDKIIFR